MTYPKEDQPLVLRKSETEEIRLYTSTYKGKTRAHIRKFWLDTKEDAWKPSREGVALTAEEARQTVEALKAILEAGVLVP
jgi:hypothetical protein